MDKTILFISYNKDRGVISGPSDTELTANGYYKPLTIKLPVSELERFEKKNNLHYDDKNKCFTLPGKQQLLRFTSCKFIRKDDYGVEIYEAESWEWV